MIPASATRIWTRRPGPFTSPRPERSAQLIDEHRRRIACRVGVHEHEGRPAPRLRFASYRCERAHALAGEDEKCEEREPGARGVERRAVGALRTSETLGERRRLV